MAQAKTKHNRPPRTLAICTAVGAVVIAVAYGAGTVGNKKAENQQIAKAIEFAWNERVQEDISWLNPYPTGPQTYLILGVKPGHEANAQYVAWVAGFRFTRIRKHPTTVYVVPETRRDWTPNDEPTIAIATIQFNEANN